MDLAELNVNKMLEKKAITATNGCSIYALAAAIVTLCPELTEEEFYGKVNALISPEIQDTTLGTIAAANDLPPILYFDSGGTTVIKWINKGFGYSLMEYLNDQFATLGLQVSISFRHRIERDAGGILQSVRDGSVIMLPSVVLEDGDEINHHIALVYQNGKYLIADINNPITEASETILTQLLSDSSDSINYGPDSVISIREDPLLVLNKI